MEIIENNSDEYNNYFYTKMFFQNEELNGLAMMEMVGTGYHDLSSPDGAAGYEGYHNQPCLPDVAAGYGVCHDSSSPDGGASSAASKNIVSERNRRKKLTERLLALREVVPKISKLDKASIIKDAIDYIQELHEQKGRIEAELKELESKKFMMRNPANDFDFGEELPALLLPSKKKRIDQLYDLRGCTTSPIEVLELRIDDMGEKTLLVRLKCVKRPDTVVKLCEVFENLNVKIITANITTISGRILTKTVFIEADEDEKDYLKIIIEKAIYYCSCS